VKSRTKKLIVLCIMLISILTTAMLTTASAHQCSFTNLVGYYTICVDLSATQHTRYNYNIFRCTANSGYCDKTKDVLVSTTVVNHSFSYVNGTHNTGKNTHTYNFKCSGNKCSRTKTTTSPCYGPPCNLPQGIELEKE